MRDAPLLSAGAEAVEHDVLADDERRGRGADLAHECSLVGEVLLLSLDQLLDLVEVLQEIELDLVLERVEPIAYRSP